MGLNFFAFFFTGTAGSKAFELCSKFEVIVIDEAAQSVEPSSLTALQLGSKHCILVGDPQQLPATIFSLSGKSTKYDRRCVVLSGIAIVFFEMKLIFGTP
jgi:hypothetical protein